MTRSADRRLSQKWDTSRLKTGLKPYPKYVSRHGVPWLPPVPSHWSIVSNRIAFQETDETNHPNEAMLSVTIGRGVILQSDLIESRETDHQMTLDRSQHKLVEPDDIVYNKMRAWQGAIGASEYRGLISPDYVVEKPRMGVNAKYVGYLFRTPIFADEARRWSYGIASDRWRLRHKDFKSIHICLPPADEQASIVRYLDRADELINRYISAKERLIALLEEQREAVIHRAVTRGLDHHAKFQQTHVPYIGEIPAHWQTQRLKATVNEVADQVTARESNEIYIQLENVESWTGQFQDAGPDATFESAVKRFKPNDVLFGKLRPYLAKVARPQQKGVCVGEFLVLRPEPAKLHPRYLEQLLLTKPILNEINSSTFGAKMPRADWQFIGNLAQPVPPMNEQLEICNHIDSFTSNIHIGINRTQRQIALINEYRTRLIADAVTGQLDVRDVAVELPT